MESGQDIADIQAILNGSLFYIRLTLWRLKFLWIHKYTEYIFMLRGKRKAFLNIFRGSKKKETLSPKETEWFLVFNVKNLR